MTNRESSHGAAVIDHPLVRIRLTRLRDSATSHEDFRRCLHEISQLMLFEITRDIETKRIAVSTPIDTTGGEVAARPVVLVPILRAGLGMLRGLLHILPDALIGHIGMRRNEKTLEPETYFCKFPPGIAEADVFLIDPMLATGNSGADAIRQLKASGVTRIRFFSIISCPEGIIRIRKNHPDVPVFTAAVDDGLNEKGYIVPGLGDAGDRYFGTV